MGPVEGQCCGSCPSLPPIIIPGMGSVELCTTQEDGCLPTDGGMGYPEAQAMDEYSVQRNGDRLPFQIFPDPVEVVLSTEGCLTCAPQGKERLPSIVVEPTDISEVESGELRWPPEDMDFDEDEDLFLEQCIPPANIADWGEDEEESSVIENHQQNTSLLLAEMEEYDSDFADDYNVTDWCEGSENCTAFVLPTVPPLSMIGSMHWIALVCYLIVFLLGVPGNALVAWVTAFRMPNSVNAQWFLNLAIADLLCCLSLPLLMVPLAQDQHWPYGALGCKLLKGLLYMMMYCSVLLLVVISLDRFLLVTKPVWCQNHRNTRQARCVCLVVWILALLACSPQLAHMEIRQVSETKTLCESSYNELDHAWAITLTRCFLSFLLPFLIICISHWKVYITTSSSRGQRGSDKSARTLRVILALVLSFFLCWSPLNIVDILELMMHKQSESLRANLRLAHVLTLCLAYINSCLNPLLYVCLGRGFKENLISSLRSVLHFASEGPPHRISMTANSKSTTGGFREKPL